MYDTASDLPSLISARICHDLASPLGAIANGLELLELSGLADTPEAALLGDSIASATARVEFFRIAYGAANPETMLSPGIAQRRLQDSFGERKITVAWDIPGDVPRSDAKLLFLLLQSTESALPYGGEVSVTPAASGWVIHASGREIRMDPLLWSLLTGGETATDLQSSQVHFALAKQQAATQNRTISINADDTTLAIRIS